MTVSAARLIPHVLLVQSGCSVVGLLLFLGVAPRLLHFDTGESRPVLELLLLSWVVASLLSLWATYRRVRRYRFLLHALTLGSHAFEAVDLAGLSLAPAYIALTFAALSAVFAFVPSAPFLVARGGHLGTLVLLSMVLGTTVALPLYVLVRGQVARAIELALPETSQQALALLEPKKIPLRYELLHMTSAIAVPVFIVATATALVAFAHEREASTEVRQGTAFALAQSLFEVAPNSLSPALRQQLSAQAAARGFFVTFSPDASLPAPVRGDAGEIVSLVPLTHGQAIVSFHTISGPMIAPGVALTWVVTVGLGILIGLALGYALANDLALAARQVRSLGKEGILRGSLPAAGRARFAVVARLGRAIEALTQRFRTFAEAQERVLAARRASLRLRSLLFASVSHDLKSPLNAILGFCAVAATEPLSEPQRDSLRIIEGRGRELLALLETILDSARVEAKRLTLEKNACDVRQVVTAAVARGDDLGPMNAAAAEVNVEEGLPEVFWDEVRVAQAIAALIGHAKRLSPQGGVQVDVRRRSASTLRVTVTEPSEVFSPLELTHLLDASHATTVPKRMGGLALGLSLARSLVVMHGGSLDVRPSPATGGSLFEMVLPLRA